MTMTPQSQGALAPFDDTTPLAGEEHDHADALATVLPMRTPESEWVTCSSCGMDVKADRLDDHARTQH
jgi:hypothetical protein